MEEIVRALNQTRGHKAKLEVDRARMVRRLAPVDVGGMDTAFIREVIENLKPTIRHAGLQERKAHLQEIIHRIRIPKKGEALLEFDPAGLQSPKGACA